MRKTSFFLLNILLLYSQGALADLLDSFDTDIKTHSESKDRSTPKKEKENPQNDSTQNKQKRSKENSDKRSESRKKTKALPSAKKGDKKQAPVHFQGLGLTGLKSEGMVVLRKEVVVTQEDFKLESDEAKIYLEDDSNDVKSVLAEGRVKITKKDETTGKLVKANADQAEFDNLTQLITLRGNAKVVKGEDVLTGNLIFYNLKTGWIKVEKVKGVVNP